MSDRTVQRWRVADTFPEAKQRRRKASSFDAFAPPLLKRWKQGERKGAKLLGELREQGYQGSGRTVYRSLEALKQTESEALPLILVSCGTRQTRQSGCSSVIWTLLSEVEREAIVALRQASRVLDTAYCLDQDFFCMLHQREGYRLDQW